MTHPLTLREKVARAALRAEMNHSPGVWDTEPEEWSVEALEMHGYFAIADAIITALASGSGDHAELARLAEEALLPIPEKRRKSWFNRQNRFRDAANPATVLALLAENAALRAKAGLADMLGEKLERRTFALDEAERKLAEAVGLVERSIDLMTDEYADTKAYREEARTFLSKEAERG